MGKTINFEDVSEGTYVKYTFLSIGEKLESYYGVIDKKYADKIVHVRWFNHECFTFEQPMAYRVDIDTSDKVRHSGDWELVDNHSERG